jgi:dUTP pyrophosphatase
MMELYVQLLDEQARVPARTRADDAGYDLCCLDGITIEPAQRQLVKTGVAIALPDRYCGLLVPRSGLAARHGISVVNAPGLIDPSYRGEVQVILLNTGSTVFHAPAGSRIAQLLIVPFATPTVTVTEQLSDSRDGRGRGGFGSSGL